MGLIGAALLSFLLGSLPFAWAAGKLRGVDLRRAGSGNLGAANAARNLGAFLGIAVALLDAGKGVAAVLLVSRLGAGDAAAWGLPGIEGPAMGAAAMLGHVFCPWLGWKGGKGVAVGAAAAFSLAPLAGAASLAAFVVVALARRYVSLASIAAAAVLPVAYLFCYPADRGFAFTLAFFAAAFAFIVATHRANIGRLLRGEEPRFSLRPSGAARG